MFVQKCPFLYKKGQKLKNAIIFSKKLAKNHEFPFKNGLFLITNEKNCGIQCIFLKLKRNSPQKAEKSEKNTKKL